jgi:pSer/pThr/pTyr-binding forkhead associated (FHA) protein
MYGDTERPNGGGLMSDPGPGAQSRDDPSGGSENPSEKTRDNVSESQDTTITFDARSKDIPPTTPGWSSNLQAAIDAPPVGSALLVVQHGAGGARFLLATDRITAGRNPSSDIFLDDVTVSRKHAEFLRRDGGFVLHDLGSLNGTYIGRDRIDEAVLRNGAEVRIGKFRMVFYASRRTLGPTT